MEKGRGGGEGVAPWSGVLCNDCDTSGLGGSSGGKSGSRASATASKQKRYCSGVCIIPPLCFLISRTVVSISTRPARLS